MAEEEKCIFLKKMRFLLILKAEQVVQLHRKEKCKIA